MATLMEKSVLPSRIAFLTGELIDDHHSLVRLITQTLQEMPAGDIRYLIIDEVTYIRDWDKGITYLADAGLLENGVVVLTGSDLVIIQEARMRFREEEAKPIAWMFTNPFIFHAVRAWLKPDEDPFGRQVGPLLADPKAAAALVEACAVTHFGRHYPTYYIKTGGEVDIAYVQGITSTLLKLSGPVRLGPKV